jgi:hypothetical protein
VERIDKKSQELVSHMIKMVKLGKNKNKPGFEIEWLTTEVDMMDEWGG